MIRKYLGWLFSKIVSLSQTYGSKVIECGGWGDDGIGRQGGGGDHRFQNHGCWLIFTKILVLKD